MSLLRRFPLLLFQPDYATSDLYDSPPLGHAFIIVSASAVISSLKPLIGVISTTDNVRYAIFIFLASIALVYFTWLFLTFFFHFIADFVGGTGELHNAIAFVGLAAAPNVVVSVVGVLITVANIVLFPEEPDVLLSMANLGASLIGMMWGWPGMLCYFGLKNAERVSSIKAILIVLPVFAGFAFLEVYNSSLLKP